MAIIVKLMAINVVYKYDTIELFEKSLDFQYSKLHPELFEIIEDR